MSATLKPEVFPVISASRWSGTIVPLKSGTWSSRMSHATCGCGEICGALGEPDGGTEAEVAVDRGEGALLVGLLGQEDAQVTERDLDAALVVRGQVAARGRVAGGLEIRGALRAEATHEDHPRL